MVTSHKLLVLPSRVLLHYCRGCLLLGRTMSSATKRKSCDGGEIVSPTKKPKIEVNGEAKVSFEVRIHQQRAACAKSVLEFKFLKKRVCVLSKEENFPDDAEGVLYWMSRDQRVQDNWAFLYAQRMALKLEVPLHVCFCLMPKFLDATIRHYDFLLKGLQEVQKECQKLNIEFHLMLGEAKTHVPEFVKTNKIGALVTDFSPLRTPLAWVEGVKNGLPETVPFCQVDAHNIVPCWEASPKLEYGARTIRNKINSQLGTYLTEFPPVVMHKFEAKQKAEEIDWEAAEKSLQVDRTVKPVDWAKPGSEAGLLMLESFIKQRLRFFNADRNNPNKDALRQLSVQRAMLMVRPYKSKCKESVEGYLEEGIVRRELADNFCFYNKHYDNVKGAYDWARKTLKDHAGDKREYLYSREQLEKAKTHDQLWNAAQKQLVVEGKMHGFLRMYWAKKILEWTDSPETALSDAIYLNDKYSLDGRDPNGYVGCMWSICGIHDQGWREREVFGKIRYMNYAGCKRKFDVAAFERKYKSKIL